MPDNPGKRWHEANVTVADPPGVRRASNDGVVTTRPILLFDGDCAFCTRSVEILERIAPADVEVVPWQFADLSELRVSTAQVEREVVWVAPDGSIAGGLQGFARYLIRAGMPWSLAGRLLTVPPIRWIGAGVYRLIANNRHRLPGGTPACAVGGPRRK